MLLMCSMRRGAQSAHLIEPFAPRCHTGCRDHPEQALAYRPDTAKRENAALEALQAMGAEIPTVNENRHAHGHDNTRALALERAPPGAAAKHERKARTKHLLEKCLEDGRKRSQPQRVDDQQMIRLADSVLRRPQQIGQRIRLEVLLRAEPGKAESGNIYTMHGVARRQRPFGTSISQRVTKMTASGIRVPLDDGDP